MSVESMCRVCEAAYDLQNLFEEENEELLHMLRCVASVSIKYDDPLPNEICNYCSYRLQMAYEFKVQCEGTDQALRATFEAKEIKYIHSEDQNNMKEVPPRLTDNVIVSIPSNGSTIKPEYTLDIQPDNELDEEQTSDCIEQSTEDRLELNDNDKNSKITYDEYQLTEDEIERLDEEFMSELAGEQNVEMVIYETHINQVSSCADMDDSTADQDDSQTGNDMQTTLENDGNQVSSTSELSTIETYNAAKTYKCSLCSSLFHNYAQFVAHKRTHSRPRVSCPLCDKTFARRSGLTEHLARHRGETKETCHICGKQCSNRGNLYRHIAQCHENIRPYECTVCGARFSRKAGLEIHSATHTDVRHIACDMCEKTFKSYIALKAHRQTHLPKHERAKLRPYKSPTPRLYVCEQCGKQSRTLSLHITHRKIHGDKKPFGCTVCGKRFLMKIMLQNHMRCHTGEKPFSCDECGKRFRQTAHVTSHKKAIHEQARPFGCSYCSKTFTSAGTLKVHERIHTGEKPYKCDICSVAYIDSNGLRKHRQKLHPDIYEETRKKYPELLEGTAINEGVESLNATENGTDSVTIVNEEIVEDDELDACLYALHNAEDVETEI